MIKTRLNEIKSWDFLEDKFQKCFQFIEENNINDLELGSYEILGKDIFVNRISLQTGTEEEKKWENHHVYIDMHVIISGSEYMNFNHIENMEEVSYNDEKDVMILKGSGIDKLLLEQGDVCICYSSDAHQGGIAVENSSTLEKLVFKIKIDL